MVVAAPTVGTGRPLRLFLSVGDISADLHAANLIREIRRLRRDAILEGLGGPQMADAGCDIRYPLTSMNVMGFKNVFQHLHTVWKTQRDTLRHFDAHPPDAVVILDFPGYNLLLARWLRKRHIPVVYYISPQIWAWHASRIHAIRNRITKVLCIFPFEETIYRDAGIPVEYVGHPLFDHLEQFALDEKFCRELRAESTGRLIGLLPGSRIQEIKALAPAMAKAAALIARELPDALFVTSCADARHERILRRILRKHHVAVRVFRSRTFEVMKEADFCLVASGTATLELAHFGTPMMIMYRVSLPAYLIAQRLMKTEFIGMVNILSGREVVPDRLLWRDQPKRIAADALDILGNPERYAEIETSLRTLREQLDHPGASRQAALSIIRTAEELRGRIPENSHQDRRS